MIKICIAEDGRLFQVNASLRDIERTGSLEVFLAQETGVDADAVLAYLSDGRRLMTSNVRELAGAQDQSIFVYNKNYLDQDLDKVVEELRIEPPLQPPIEESISATPPFRPGQLATSYLRTAQAHHESISQLAASLHYQHDAMRIACISLDRNVLAIVDAFEGIATVSRKELEKQSALLEGLEADLQVVEEVRIHTEFLSPTVRKAIEMGGEPRTLGDYVSNAKMMQVADGCAQTHEELQTRFNLAEKAVMVLSEETDTVRETIASTKLLDDVDASLRRAGEFLHQTNAVATTLEEPSSDINYLLQELKQLDGSLRSELQFSTNTKNSSTMLLLNTLRRVGVLNNDIVQIPSELASLQESFRKKNSFAHIQRLHNMLYAYGATVAEIVRRKEFSRFFVQRAQSILEIIAKLSANEKKRRQVYRSETHGQLPFEIKGMDDTVPTIDFSPSNVGGDTYTLERKDLDGLLRLLDDLERDPASSSAVKECRSSLQKLVAKMDGLEAGFDRIVERSLLSASRISHSRRRSIEADEQVYNEMVEQLRATEHAKAQQESAFQEERKQLTNEIERLRMGRDKMEREIQQARAQAETEALSRRGLEERNADMSRDMEEQRSDLARALSDATEQKKVAEGLRQEVIHAQNRHNEAAALEKKSSERVAMLLDEQARNLRILDEARARGDDLESQMKAARLESDQVNEALWEAGQEKERLMKEHDRIMRDHIAEADGDRAVLEREFFALRADNQGKERALKDTRADLEIAHADVAGLKQEVQRLEHALQDAVRVERALRKDLEATHISESDFEHRLETSERLVAQILDVALRFRTSHLKAMSTAHAVSSHPNSASKQQASSLAESVFSPGLRHSIIGQPEEPSPIDPSDPAAALEALRAFDHDVFMEAIAKTGSTIRKWQKQCKEYRERAKGKISFRNFTKGDLALFLPTRNSVSKPWAAFNVSFPHYFLQATGHLAEQLKTREWIVARITSITERVVNHDDPTSNPYGLGDGVKYYMLEVEDWTNQSHTNRRRTSLKKPTSDQLGDETKMSASLLSEPSLPPGPPEADLEDTFRVMHTPNSRLFPVRSRANSSPTARPSSLSRLLAQAPTETPLESEDVSQPESSSPIRVPSPQPTISPPPPPQHSPSIHPSSLPKHHPSLSSPLRPGSRASRMSTTSRFSISGGRVAPIGASPSETVAGANKASATTALSEDPFLSSPSSGEATSTFPSSAHGTPSPEGSMLEGMTNVLKGRRRTASYLSSSHTARASPLVVSESSVATGTTSSSGTATHTPGPSASGTLANLASNWGRMSFGRKKTGITAQISEASNEQEPDFPETTLESTASTLLKRF